MSNKYKIKSTPVDILVKQAKVYGTKDTVHLLYHQLKEIKFKTRQINYYIKLKKLDYYIDNYENYKEKDLYTLLLADLKNIDLSFIEEYRALIYFLEGLTAYL